MDNELPVWAKPQPWPAFGTPFRSECPQCGKPLKAVKSVYGEWECDRHPDCTKRICFNYELTMMLMAKNAKLQDALRQIEAQVTPGDYDAHWSAIRMAGIASAALQENAQCQP